jgi:membrane protein
MSVGVAATTEVLPFAMQMGEAQGINFYGVLYKALCAVTAGMGTVSFALLYQVHYKYFWDIGIIGSVSWFIYLMVEDISGMDSMAVLFSGIFAAVFSRSLAAKRKCPATIFLSTSIFPLIPGIGVYKAIYYLITGNGALSLKYGRSCFLTAFTIAIAIGIVQQIPQSFFQKKSK